MIIDAILKYFIPDKISQHLIKASYAKNLVWVCLISLIVSPLYALLFYYFNDHVAAYTLLLNEIILLLPLMVLKYSKSLPIAANLYIISLICTLTYIILNQGGFDSRTAYWLISPSLVATLIGGIQVGIIWCCITTCIISALYFLMLIHFPLPAPTVENPFMLKFVSISNLNIIILALICFYESTRNWALNKLSVIAYQDMLTGLPNRLAYEKYILALKENHETRFTVFYIDIRNFKKINVMFGARISNALLRKIAKRLKKHNLGADLIARVSGDEFKIVINKNLDLDEIKEIASILIAILRIPYHMKDHEIHISFSIGIASFNSIESTIKKTDQYTEIALSHAKMRKGSHYVIFNEKLKNEAMFKISIEEHLSKAISNSELYLTFQPIFNAKDVNKVTHFETLLRWRNSELGEVSPDFFIPIAENTNFINLLDKWVFKKACEEYMKWKKLNLFFQSIPITINISAQHLYDTDFVGFVQQTIRDAGLLSENIIIELTETAVLYDQNLAANILLKLNEIGIKTIIDDFGVGQTSLSYLATLPIAEIKIDKSFVQNIMSEENSNDIIIKSLIDLAHKLNLKVVAEGIETVEQLNFLVQSNCDSIQGFYLSKPLEVEEMNHFLKMIENN